MKLLGFSFHQFLSVGLAASLFILVVKWLGPKTNVPAIAATTAKL